MHRVKLTIHVIETTDEAEAQIWRYRRDQHRGTWS
jgi:hypothetical protein